MTLAAFLHHLAFCAGLAATSALVVLAMLRTGIADRPDARKAHTRTTPKGGGVGVVAAFLLGITVLYGYSSFSRLAEPYFRGVILSAAAIALVSYLDDLRDWPFVIKLAAQLVAGMAAVGSGLFVEVFHLPYIRDVDLGWAGGAAVTLGWLLFATNAMNFIDGLDGLAGGTGLVACLFLAWIGERQGGWFVYFAALLLASGLAGFLPFNFPRARIFLGDVGSQFCGFVLAVLGVAAARFEGVALSFLLVPMLLSGVLFDVAFTLLRRVLAGQSITRAHRSFLFQIAHRAGMEPRRIAVLHWSFAAFGGLVALAFEAAPGVWKVVLPFAVLPPQLVWLGYVVWRARVAGIGRW